MTSVQTYRDAVLRDATLDEYVLAGLPELRENPEALAELLEDLRRAFARYVKARDQKRAGKAS